MPDDQEVRIYSPDYQHETIFEGTLTVKEPTPEPEQQPPSGEDALTATLQAYIAFLREYRAALDCSVPVPGALSMRGLIMNELLREALAAAADARPRDGE